MRTRLGLFSLLIACLLFLLPVNTHLQTPSPSVPLPQTLPAMKGELARLAEIVFRNGKERTLIAGAAETLGFGRQEISIRFINTRDAGRIRRDIFVTVLDGTVHLVLTHHAAKEETVMVIRTTSEGIFVLGVLRTNPTISQKSSTDQKLLPEEGKTFLDAEKKFWLKWLTEHPSGL